MEDWALIRRLVAECVRQRHVVRELGIDRSTVERVLVSDRPAKYQQPSGPTAFTPFEPHVRELLAKKLDMLTTVIAARVGLTSSITWFRGDNVRRLWSEHRPVDPADRLAWLRGDAARCDPWFPPKKVRLEDGMKTLSSVKVITSAHSWHHADVVTLYCSSTGYETAGSTPFPASERRTRPT